MHTSSMRRGARTARTLCSAAVALAFAAPQFACAQSAQAADVSPYYIGVRETVSHDNNVDRTPNALADMLFSTGVFGGIDEMLGRQHLTGNAEISEDHYQDVSRLNHTEGDGLLHLDWETVHDISGDAQVSHSQSLFHAFTAASQAATQKVIYQTTDAVLNARVGVVTRWTLEGGLSATRTRYSSFYAPSDVNYDGWRLGTRFTPSDLLNVGLAYRHTNGEYPNLSAGVVESDFSRDDVDLDAYWSPTATSTLKGRISRSRLTYQGTAPDNLTTGQVAYRWHPGGRTSLELSYARDANDGQYGYDTTSSFFGQPISVSQQSLTSRVSDTADLQLHYDLTGKIQLTGELNQARRKLDNLLSQSTNGGPPGSALFSANDTTTAESLGATYAFSRSLQFSCSVVHTKRTANDNGAGLTYPFSDTLAACTGQFALQP